MKIATVLMALVFSGVIAQANQPAPAAKTAAPAAPAVAAPAPVVAAQTEVKEVKTTKKTMKKKHTGAKEEAANESTSH